MIEGTIRFSEHKNKFYDEFGNRINNYIVEKYFKHENEWVLEEIIKTYVGSYFVVDGKFYFRGNNDCLIPLNMDFESKTCGACYKILEEDKEEYKKITGNVYLCENKYLNLKLHKQDYSDNTSFYTLEDNLGEFKVDYGNSDLRKLIEVLERGMEIDKNYEDILPTIKTKIQETEKLISDIKQFIE